MGNIIVELIVARKSSFSNNTHRRVRGFTLVELLVALMCLGLLMAPMIWVYRSGSRTALEGRVKAEITLEARNVLRQIHDDLKYSVFLCDYSAYSANVSVYFPGILSSNSETTYSLWRFPLHGSVDEAIEPDGSVTAFRIPTQITYELKQDNPPLFSLYRQEGPLRRTVLSRRINFFDIKENPLAPPRTSWLVTLQLAEIVKPLGDDLLVKKLQSSEHLSVREVERRLLERTRSVQIADFFDTVASEYYVFAGKTSALFSWPTLLKK
jgi:prepilin-type N-terminal cleavage/methylation domain-containing protein